MQGGVIGHLVPGRLYRAGSAFALESRLLGGLEAMAQLWDGPLVLLADEEPASEAPDGSRLVSAADLPFDVQLIPMTSEAIDGEGLDLVSTMHSPLTHFVSEARTPAVLTCEQTFRIRRGIYASTLDGPSLVRATAGLVKVEARLRRDLRAAASAQFNGPASYKSYGHLVESPLRYQDHRVLAEDVKQAAEVASWDGVRPLRMAFSGRLLPLKGPGFALELAQRAYERGLPVEVHFFGDGPLRDGLSSAAPPGVFFHGFKEFRTEWLPEVRERIDLMVMPHVQGDPSCTYFEALGSGAPILGFANETLTPLVEEHRVGWAVRRKDVNAMFEQLRWILDHPEELLMARQRGLNLVADNTFETTMRRRVEHLQEFARANA